MSAFSGSNSRNEHLVPMWKLAERNNQKPVIFTRRKTKKGERVPVLMG